MNIASIDIGTNTILLLIAKIDKNNIIEILHDELAAPRLGESLQVTGLIKDSKVIEAEKYLDHYFEIIKNYNCSKVIISATHAIRTAKNGNEILNHYSKKYGYEFYSISGLEEAEYSYLGSISSSSEENKIVIDIGGGSSEIIFGKNESINNRFSFKIGAVTLKDLANKMDYTKVKSILNEIIELDKIYSNSNSAIAIAGTAVSIFCMLNKLKNFDKTKIEGGSFTIDELRNLIEIIENLSPETILSRYGDVLKGRQDIILYGAYILLYLMELLNLEKIIVSTNGLRYGAIIKYLQTKD